MMRALLLPLVLVGVGAADVARSQQGTFPPAPGAAGSLTPTGLPATGNLSKWSGGTSLTSGDLSGDCSTAGTLVVVCLKTNGVAFGPFATATDAVNLTGTLANARLANAGVTPINAVSCTLGSACTVYAPPLCESAAAVATPADTSEDILASCPVPANALGANGCVEIHAIFSLTGSTNSKTVRVRFGGIGGSTYASAVTTTATNITYGATATICNRGATNSQMGSNNFTAFGLAAQVTGAVDTTASTTIVVTGQKASPGETLQLERYDVVLRPAA